MMYVVMYYEGYVGYHKSAETKLFDNEVKAREYARVLNEEMARESHCKVDDLGDWYDVIELEW